MNEGKRSQMIRYIIDESVLSFEVSRELGIALLRWAADRADRFVLTLDESVYVDPLGVIRLFEPFSIEVTRHEGGSTIITGETPPASLTDLVTDRSFLNKSVSGDLTNVEDVAFYILQRRHYLAADYGRTQILFIDPIEISQLRSLLRDVGLDESVLKELPFDPT
ncbi:MAG: hypothetical protein ABSG18_27095 [Steroidobacteraceae bacterium]|jgi:hypothetical protein